MAVNFDARPNPKISAILDISHTTRIFTNEFMRYLLNGVSLPIFNWVRIIGNTETTIVITSAAKTAAAKTDTVAFPKTMVSGYISAPK